MNSTGMPREVEKAKIAVKVGNASKLLLKKVDAYRAITLEELDLILDKHDIKNVVIEEIRDDEMESAASILERAYENGISLIVHGEKLYQRLAENMDDGWFQLVRTEMELYNTLEEKLSGVYPGLRVNWKEQEEGQGESSEGQSTGGEHLEEEGEEENSWDGGEESQSSIDINKELIKGREELEHLQEKYKNDILKLKGELLSSSTENKDIKVRLEEAKSEIESIRKKMLDSGDQLKVYMESEERLKEEIENLRSVEDTLNKEIGDLKAEIDDIKNELAGGREELEGYQGIRDRLSEKDREIQAYEGRLKEKDAEIGKCRNIIDDLNTKMTRLEQLDTEGDIQGLEKQLREQTSLIESLRNELEELKKVNIDIESDRVLLEIDKGNLENELRGRLSEIEELNTVLENVEGKLRDRGLEFQQLKNNYDFISNEQNEINNKMSMVIDNLRRDGELLSEKNGHLERELGNLRSTIKEKEEQIAILKGASDKEDMRILLDTKERLEKENKELRGNLSILSDKLEAEEKGLVANILCKYNGKARIIPVFGSGSYGITTTAMSIARKIGEGGRVLLMDMDMTSPKADIMFAMTPIIKGLEGLDMLMRTGYGALVEKGVDYIRENERHILRSRKEIRNGDLSYFSGMYHRANRNKILNAGYEELLEFLGDKFDYIVVDLGRLGSSDVSDAIIKMFTRVSHKNVIVTLKDKGDVRNMGLKIQDTGVELQDCLWVLNLADDTKVDPVIMKVVDTANVLIMPKVMQMYSTGKTYDKVVRVKDKLSELLELLE